ncbi:alanine racemase [Psychrobacter phenylpyruvicus]|uniref:Alanine racemase n=1 Tax=Psychrobacter phenylpyruvicus TaxID=29432 RepID=A0A379LL31_9GAMM|nr:alanine racemase [Psychrobacter phenylpyruvicus]SUD91253.1 Alanine racemase, biosynthetic [Psychrobacter phenylpyruvicus]
MRNASITLNSAALTHNLNQVIKKIPEKTKILAMVKADAYGHGVKQCIPSLQQADALGVACFDEAKQIRSLGWQKGIVLIEGVFSQQEWAESIEAECQSIIHHQNQVQWALQQLPAADSACRTLWLKLNTGMNRLGFEPEEIVAVAKTLVDAGYNLILTSHFANADRPDHPSNANQIKVFTGALTDLRQQVDSNIKASLCNSAGIINFPECHFDWVRPGIMLYGSTPLEGISAQDLQLKPVMTFEASLMAIHNIAAGAPVGYGSRFVANRPIVKGIVSIGYGDGYPRVVDGSAWVTVKQTASDSAESEAAVSYKCPVIGRVAMDMIAIDLTEVPNPTVGYKVVLWGDPDQAEPSVDEIANSAHTLGYELLCRVTQRPTRVVI